MSRCLFPFGNIIFTAKEKPQNAIDFLLFLLSHPFREFLLQLFLAGQVKLVFAGVNVGIFWEG